MTTTSIAHCARCAVRLQRTAGNPEARLLKRTTDDYGFCVNCAITEWLKSLPIVSERPKKMRPLDPRCFRFPHVQDQMARLLAVGHADANPEEIDWDEVIANWELPFPTRKKRGKP